MAGLLELLTQLSFGWPSETDIMISSGLKAPGGVLRDIYESIMENSWQCFGRRDATAFTKIFNDENLQKCDHNKLKEVVSGIGRRLDTALRQYRSLTGYTPIPHTLNNLIEVHNRLKISENLDYVVRVAQTENVESLRNALRTYLTAAENLYKDNGSDGDLQNLLTPVRQNLGSCHIISDSIYLSVDLFLNAYIFVMILLLV